LGGGFSCGFEGAGLLGVGGVGVGGEVVEAVEGGDAGLGGDGLFADLCDFVERFEGALEHGRLDEGEDLVECELELFADGGDGE
jgi:hypothetical protein